MQLKQVVVKLVPVLVIGAAIAAAMIWWPQKPQEEQGQAEVWTCSMHPQIRLPKPGQCPICGMNLIPVSRLEAEQSQIVKRAGIETEAVERRELFKEVRTVGKLDYNERRVAYISARTAGRIDRIYADFTGIAVNEGDHLVDVYSPDLNVAQRELLIGLEAHEREQKRTPSEGRASFADSTLESVRTKLRLLGILPEQIAEIERTRKTTTHLTIFAPIGGTIIEKNVRLGQYVKDGDPLYRIADLDPIWLYLNIYEYDLAWVRFGQPAEVTLEAFPGETFRGTLTFIDPFLDDATRTVRVRVNLKNPDRRLKPQMYATATIRVPLRPDGSPEPTGLEGKYICPMHPEVVQVKPGKCSICEMPLERVPELMPSLTPSSAQLAQRDGDDELAIPVSAVLDTGRRRIAYRLTNDGAYELVELKLGPRAQAADDSGRRRDYYLVLDGLKHGDKVVVQSGFLLDSQRQIEGMPSLLFPTGQSASISGHSGHGGPSAIKGSGDPTSQPPATKMPAGHKH
ncbi:MAG: efflux RND transporter periplasmic adaptor subunit [Planctomycetia bacterium]|nr:efflux RND transporter periplasmic adaptor subunit [Planctomycetia bacterium]